MLPEWLSIRPASTQAYSSIKEQINSSGLHTVCVEAHCPNISECWSSGTATFMVLGELCTRGCRFCAVQKRAKGVEVDAEEPEKLGKIVQKWGLDYIVVTSVCRDDLPDQGAGHFAACVAAIKRYSPKTRVEVLIPDFRDDESCIKKITEAHPDVVGHNIETVERLSAQIRDRRANYTQSLAVLRKVKELDSGIYTKTAIMLGLGEKEEELEQAFDDLRAVGVDFLAMGQYLRPSQSHAEVVEYVRPERFEELRKMASSKGFAYVAAGPFVRSSYMAGEAFVKGIINGKASILNAQPQL